jgi:hypothetical protein
MDKKTSRIYLGSLFLEKQISITTFLSLIMNIEMG